MRGTGDEGPKRAADEPERQGRAELIWACVVLAVLAVLVVLKTFRPVNPYATGHWLFNYGHGFIRRGLIGTLFKPIAYGLPPARVQKLIHVIGWSSTCVFLALFVRAGVRAGAGVFGRRGRAGDPARQSNDAGRPWPRRRWHSLACGFLVRSGRIPRRG